MKELDESENSVEIYRKLWNSYIKPVCDLIRMKNYDEAERIYTEMVERVMFLPISSLCDVVPSGATQSGLCL